jgi:hypothetical protein
VTSSGKGDILRIKKKNATKKYSKKNSKKPTGGSI